MSMRQRIGGRSSFMLYLAFILILALVAVLAVIFLVIIPDRQRRWEAEAQRMQATATAEARAAEAQRAYAAGVAFAAAGDWDKAAEEFAKVVALEPTYKDVVVRLAEAHTRAEAVSGTATATARENDLQRAYSAGVAFAVAEEWDKAAEQFARIIAIDPGYKDAAGRLAEARKKAYDQAAAAGQATATALARETAIVEARIRTTAAVQETATAQARQDLATAQARATREADVVHATATAQAQARDGEIANYEWIRRNPSVAPPDLGNYGIAYDRRRSVFVLFGGVRNSGLSNETWEWDGRTWTKRQLSN